MKNKSSTKKPLVNKADLDKIKTTVEKNSSAEDIFSGMQVELESHATTIVEHGMYRWFGKSFHKKLCREVTSDLNEMYAHYTKYLYNSDAYNKGMGNALDTLFKFANKTKILRLVHIPSEVDNVISFKVYIARINVCRCSLRVTSLGIASVRFTN